MEEMKAGVDVCFSFLRCIVAITVAMNAKSGRNRQILCTAEPRHAACLPDMPHAILLAEYANAAPFLMRFSVLRAAGCPLTSCLICSRLQTCATTTTTTQVSAEAGRDAVGGCASVARRLTGTQPL